MIIHKVGGTTLIIIDVQSAQIAFFGPQNFLYKYLFFYCSVKPSIPSNLHHESLLDGTSVFEVAITLNLQQRKFFHVSFTYTISELDVVWSFQ